MRRWFARKTRRPQARLSLEALEDRQLLSTTTVFTVDTALDETNPNDNKLSLREAILAANNNPGLDQIAFAIGTGIKTINLNSALPAITDPVMIDGTTQPGFAGKPLIVLDGSNAGSTASGLVLQTYGNTIRGLVINNFAGGRGIDIEFQDSNTIAGNYIGTNQAGTAAAPNLTGVYINTGRRNTIGGTTVADRNLISGNLHSGVYIFGVPPEDRTGNTVLGNYIGTTLSGTTALGNGYNGVTLDNTDLNMIGGNTTPARNIISANGLNGAGLLDDCQGNTIAGNYIGTDKNGTAALGNAFAGVNVDNSSTTYVGDGSTAGRNLISGNRGDGVSLTGGAQANWVQGNFIGTAVNGTTALANAFSGVRIDGSVPTGSGIPNANSNNIGGNVAGNRNVISGNGGDGVTIVNGAWGDAVQGNYIGTDKNGTAALGNAFNGVSISGPSAQANTDNLIGGASTGTRNIISGNQGDGVVLSAGANYNQVQGNYIGTNVAGIGALGNHYDGVDLDAAASNLIGGANGAARNVVSGNLNVGIGIRNGSTSNKVQGNYIGTDKNGTAGLGNASDGIFVGGASTRDNVIGGSGAAARNVIANNGVSGVEIRDGANHTTVDSNYIGTDKTGAVALGNYQNGVTIVSAGSNTTGGSSSGVRNVISGNGASGIALYSANSNTIRGNYIGTNATASAAVANTYSGVYLNHSNTNSILSNVVAGNTIDGIALDNGSTSDHIISNYLGTNSSGTDLGNGFDGVDVYGNAKNATVQNNTIAFNHNVGVGVATGSTGIWITTNSIYSNGGLGIDLGDDGVTNNDTLDADTGANTLQNFPTFGAFDNGGGYIELSGTLFSTPNTNVSIEFFLQVTPDPSFYGEGQGLFASTSGTTDGNGKLSFDITLYSPTTQDGWYVSATASAGTNTSEFSAAYPVVPGHGGLPGKQSPGVTPLFARSLESASSAQATAPGVTNPPNTSVLYVALPSGLRVAQSGEDLAGHLATRAASDAWFTALDRVGLETALGTLL